VPRSEQTIEKREAGSGDADIVRGLEMALRPQRHYRGSSSRIRRLKWRAQTPAGIWILFSLALSAIFILLACLARLS
jgi:hypothetical protein